MARLGFLITGHFFEYIFSASLFISMTLATCNVFSVPITNVTLPNKQIARGLSLAVGTPPQSLAFMPQYPLNNSIVFGTNCIIPASETAAWCTTFRGGQFNPLSSTSKGLGSSSAVPTDSYYQNNSWFTDSFQLTDNLTLDKFTLGSPNTVTEDQQGYYPMNAIGLGTNSTFLNHLINTKQIASRSWSMFWGQVGANSFTQMDGSVVFGGYDKAKIVPGKNLTQKFDWGKCGSGMLANLTDVRLTWNNGTEISLWGESKPPATPVCISPSLPGLMQLPYDPELLAFLDLTGGSYNNLSRTFGLEFYTWVYKSLYNVYSGSLTLRLNDQIDIQIPNDQLILPNRIIQPSGEIVANGSLPNLPWNSLQASTATQIAQLGRIFLTSAYIMANQDAEEWTLWQANLTPNQDLVAVDTNNKDMNASSCLSSISPLPAKAAESSLSAGAIAGIIIGAVSAVVVVAVLVFLLRRYKNQNRPTINSDTTPEKADTTQAKYAPTIPLASPLPQELPAESWGSRRSELG